MFWKIHISPKQILCAEFNPTPDDQIAGGKKMFLPKTKQMEIWLNTTSILLDGGELQEHREMWKRFNLMML